MLCLRGGEGKRCAGDDEAGAGDRLPPRGVAGARSTAGGWHRGKKGSAPCLQHCRRVLPALSCVPGDHTGAW